MNTKYLFIYVNVSEEDSESKYVCYVLVLNHSKINCEENTSPVKTNKQTITHKITTNAMLSMS